MLDMLWIFEDVDVETSTHMPCDMAMERPDTWNDVQHLD